MILLIFLSIYHKRYSENLKYIFYSYFLVLNENSKQFLKILKILLQILLDRKCIYYQQYYKTFFLIMLLDDSVTCVTSFAFKEMIVRLHHMIFVR